MMIHLMEPPPLHMRHPHLHTMLQSPLIKLHLQATLLLPLAILLLPLATLLLLILYLPKKIRYYN
jgi:hypothetical protein